MRIDAQALSASLGAALMGLATVSCDGGGVAGSATTTLEVAGTDKVSLCHATGNDRYVAISVAAAAEPAHRAHGDAAKGEAVPGQPGRVFDESCRPVGAGRLTYRLTDLGTCIGNFVNASGQVAGTYGPGDGSLHAVLWDGKEMVDFGTLGGALRSWANDINDSGQVTGASEIAPGDAYAFVTHAFVSEGTEMVDLGTLGGAESDGLSINNSGKVTGWADTAEGERHAFVWDGTAMVDLGTLGGAESDGLSINDSGQVTGVSTTADGGGHAILWDGTKMVDLGTLGGSSSWGIAINDSGQVIGEYVIAGGMSRAFLWDGTKMVDLGTLGGSYVSAVAMNDSGQVTGHSQTAEGTYHAFLWDGTKMVDLGTQGGTGSFATGINDSGQVTGYSETADAQFHPFLWDGASMYDLNDLVDSADPLKPYVTLVGTKGINDRGQILAWGEDRRGGQNNSHSYLVTPITSN